MDTTLQIIVFYTILFFVLSSLILLIIVLHKKEYREDICQAWSNFRSLKTSDFTASSEIRIEGTYYSQSKGIYYTAVIISIDSIQKKLIITRPVLNDNSASEEKYKLKSDMFSFGDIAGGRIIEGEKVYSTSGVVFGNSENTISSYSGTTTGITSSLHYSLSLNNFDNSSYIIPIFEKKKITKMAEYNKLYLGVIQFDTLVKKIAKENK